MSVRVHPISAGLGYAFLLESPEGLVLVDAGSPGAAPVILRRMAQLGRQDLRLILITHAHLDHYGAAAELRRRTGAPIAIHPADAAALTGGLSPIGSAHRHGFLLAGLLPLVRRGLVLEPTTPDLLFEDGARLDAFGLDAFVLHTPGHTPGHLSLIVENRLAFAADLIQRNPRPALQGLLATGWEQLPASLARLRALHPELTYTGHRPLPLTRAELQAIQVFPLSTPQTDPPTDQRSQPEEIMSVSHPTPRPRLAVPGDLAYIQQDSYFPAEIARRKIEASEVFVVELDGQPSGYARIEYLWSQVPYLALIWIAPGLRGRGLGTALLEFIEGFLRERGHARLYSSSQADEAAPQAWHRRSGFEECGMISGINSGGIGEIFFRKEIALQAGPDPTGEV